MTRKCFRETRCSGCKEVLSVSWYDRIVFSASRNSICSSYFGASFCDQGQVKEDFLAKKLAAKKKLSISFM
jgi:hypothetical protein